MWQKSYSITVPDIEPHQIWKIWSDVPNRAQWDDDTEWCKSDGPFQNGTTIIMKPKGWKPVTMQLIDCIPNQCFTDATSFPLARLYGIHKMEKTNKGLEITTIIKIEGLLSWLWGRLVGKDIVATLPHQTHLLIQQARKTA